MSNAEDPSVAALIGRSWSPLGRWSTTVSSAVIVEGPSHSDGPGSCFTLVRGGPFVPDEDSRHWRAVLPELAEHGHDDHHADEDGHPAHRRGDSRADEGAHPAVPEVGDP